MFSGRSSRAASDLAMYRARYPGQRDNPQAQANILFYTNRLRSQPDGDFIDVIHAKWRGAYELLESHHGYIQWLFPIREWGLNDDAQPLQQHEVTTLSADPAAVARLKASFSMMLDFYGFQLSYSAKTRRSGQWATDALSHGEHASRIPLERTVPRISMNSETCRHRFQNLCRRQHNFLRITRILKCLGEFGLEHHKLAFLSALTEMACLQPPYPLESTIGSLANFWIETVYDDTTRAEFLGILRAHTDRQGRPNGALSGPPSPSALLASERLLSIVEQYS